VLAGEALLREAKAEPELGELLYLRIKVEQGSGNTLLSLALLGEMEAIADRIGLGPESELGRMITELRPMLS
jgi:hypothetical protein